MIRRLVVVVGAAVAFVATAAPTALADPAGPTHYESTVDRIEPAVGGLTVFVVGGDSFLSVTADPGTVVIVPGYQGEPYVRIGGDGAVEVNRNSPAYWLNDDRYARVAVPSSASPDAEPDWFRVAGDGEWAWHDHRIHWMSPDRPAVEAISWSIPMEVDGSHVVVRGTLRWLHGRTPLPWLVVMATAAAVTVAASRRGLLWLGASVATAGMAALVLSFFSIAATPSGAGTDPLGWGAAAAATVCGLVTMALGIRRASSGDLPALVGTVLLIVWALRRLQTLWLPVLPTELPPSVERAMVAVVLGVSVSVFVVTFARRLAPAIQRPAQAG